MLIFCDLITVHIRAFVEGYQLPFTRKYRNFIFVSLFVSYRFGKIVDDRGIIDERDLVYR